MVRDPVTIARYEMLRDLPAGDLTFPESCLLNDYEALKEFFEDDSREPGSLFWICELVVGDGAESARNNVLRYIKQDNPPVVFHDAQKREVVALFAERHHLRRGII